VFVIKYYSQIYKYCLRGRVPILMDVHNTIERDVKGRDKVGVDISVERVSEDWIPYKQLHWAVGNMIF